MRKLVIFLSFVTFLFVIFNALDSEAQTQDKIKVFVSILPQQYFVDRIGGNLVETHVMVGPRQNPHTYEPTPKKIAELSMAKLYFRIGISFENIWIERIQGANPSMKIIDTREGIKLRSSENHHKGDHEEGLKDPHIWMSPSLVKIQAKTIYNALSELSPVNDVDFKKNLDNFQGELDKVKNEITLMLNPLKKREIMLFHPSLGYF
ncbi:zinc ABC transporter substrate-binding protein, partial [bacterium]|nr:zinc ABC transporter substrate-binding protein [bacterium]